MIGLKRQFAGYGVGTEWLKFELNVRKSLKSTVFVVVKPLPSKSAAPM